MFSYMTDLSKVDIDEESTTELECSGSFLFFSLFIIFKKKEAQKFF